MIQHFILLVMNHHTGLFKIPIAKQGARTRSVWQVLAMDFLKLHSAPTCLTLLRPAGRSPLKQPYGRFRGSTYAIHLCCTPMPRTAHEIRASDR
jgi:hypothetical protein